jgi:hypothetical protein
MRMRAVILGAVAALALALSNVLQAAVSRPAFQDDTLARAERYVARFEQTFSSVLWHERYAQEDHVPRKFTSSGTQFMALSGRRTIESDLLLLWIPREENWIAVRDVLTVDGERPREPERDVRATVGRPDVSVEDLRQLSAENGRFNIGGILRTFNEPTLTLLFLGDRSRQRFAFKRGEDDRIDDVPVVVYQFTERERPTLIRDESRDVPARGKYWIEPQTGQIVRTLLELNDRHSRVAGQITVRYGRQPAFDVLVPLEMREMYKADAGEQVTAVATYSDFRRFETAARILRK